MARDIDVYQLARAFAHKNNLTSMDYTVFSRAVQRQASLSDQSEAIYRDLAINPDSILVPRLYKLAKERRIALELIGNELATIVMPEHYANAFFAEYKRIDESPELPFPDEEGLKITVPPEWIQTVNVDTDLAHVSDRETEPLVPLYRVLFSGGIRPFVVPQVFVPEKILEYAIIKVRQYLRQGANREYIQTKLLYAFASKENQLKEMLGAVFTKPFEAIQELKSSANEMVFPFWAHLTSHVKRDLEKKQDKTAEDLSIYQAALLCEFYSGYYKSKAKRILDMEQAYRSLDQAMRKPPYHFGLDDMSAFRDSQGQPLLGKVSKEDMEAFVKRKTIEAEEGSLPELFVVTTGQGRRVYMARDRLFPLVFRLLTEARQEARTRLTGQWSRLIEDFKVVPAMEVDEDFRKELHSFIESRFPLLDALMKERIPQLAYGDLAAKGDPPADISQVFYKGELLPIDELLDLDRKALCTDAKMVLPFWYSVPILSGLVRLFRRFSSKSRNPKPVKAAAAKPVGGEGQTLKARRAAFSAAAEVVAATLVPAGYSTEDYLQELEGRWNNLLNPQAKADLLEDVNSLVRDYLRNILRSLQPSGLTTDRLKNLAAALADTPALLKIKNHAALEQYVQIYMIKLLKR